MRIPLQKIFGIREMRAWYIGISIIVFSGIIFFFFVEQKRNVTDRTACDKTATQEQAQCWADSIERAMHERGVESAFSVLTDLSSRNKNEDFARACHALVHLIGAEAYKRFAAGEKFSITDKSANCDFGFYHGFMEALLTSTGDISQARDFCRVVDAEIAARLPGIKLQCYHGIGHGAVELHDPRAKGDVMAFVKPARALCEKVSDNKEQLENCLSGVFNGIGNFYISRQNGFVIDKNDPMWICRQQPDEYKSVCYGLLARVLYARVGNEFLPAIRSAQKNVEKPYVLTVVGNIAAMETNYFGNSHEDKIIGECQALERETRRSCIQGYVSGLIQVGQPGREQVNALSFCNNTALLPEDHSSCFSRLLNDFSKMRSHEQITNLCTLIDTPYRNASVCS